MSGRKKKKNMRVYISFLFRPSCSLYLNLPLFTVRFTAFSGFVPQHQSINLTNCKMSTRNFAEKKKKNACGSAQTCVCTADRMRKRIYFSYFSRKVVKDKNVYLFLYVLRVGEKRERMERKDGDKTMMR